MQHHVPRVYLKNFCDKAGYLSVLDKHTHRVFSTGVKFVCVENNFYTLKNIDNAYTWEQTYAEGIEPIMGELLPKLIFGENPLVRNGAHIIDDNEKIELAYTMVIQMLRGKQSREHERVLFNENLPTVISNAKNRFNISEERQREFKEKIFEDENFFKSIIMSISLDRERIEKYVEFLVDRIFILYRIQGNAEFISSDNPVMFINNKTGNARMFSNGLLRPNTDIYYPLSPKLLLYASHPYYLLGSLSKYDGCIIDLNAGRETRFIATINKKQVEQCFRQAFARSIDSLKN